MLHQRLAMQKLLGVRDAVRGKEMRRAAGGAVDQDPVLGHGGLVVPAAAGTGDRPVGFHLLDDEADHVVHLRVGEHPGLLGFLRGQVLQFFDPEHPREFREFRELVFKRRIDLPVRTEKPDIDVGIGAVQKEEPPAEHDRTRDREAVILPTEEAGNVKAELLAVGRDGHLHPALAAGAFQAEHPGRGNKIADQPLHCGKAGGAAVGDMRFFRL